MTNFYLRVTNWALNRYLNKLGRNNPQTYLATIIRLQKVWASNNDVDYRAAMREADLFS